MPICIEMKEKSCLTYDQQIKENLIFETFIKKRQLKHLSVTHLLKNNRAHFFVPLLFQLFALLICLA